MPTLFKPSPRNLWAALVDRKSTRLCALRSALIFGAVCARA